MARVRRVWRAVPTWHWTAAGVVVVGVGCESLQHEQALPLANPGYGSQTARYAPPGVVQGDRSAAVQLASAREPVPPTGPTAGPPAPAADTGATTPSAPPGPTGTILPPVPDVPDPTQQPTAERIDLGAALQLAGIDNPTISLAREVVREALASQLAARSLLLPNITMGGNYRYHSGPLQDDPGELRTPTLQSFNLGFGTMAVGTNPATIPGVRLFAHLGDALYEPLAARQRVSARQSDAQATQNTVLLDVAAAYLELMGAEAQIEILRRAGADVAEISRVTSEFAKVGQGAPSDANRAAGNTDLIRRQTRQAEGRAAVASARLCRLLNLDPSVRLRTPGGAVEPVCLIPEGTDLEALVGVATAARPEVFARSAEILEAQTRVRQERTRPLFPTLSVGYSADLFGGGSNQTSPTFGPLQGRSDFDVAAVWTVQNLGFGNTARVRQAKATVGVSVAAFNAAVNQIRREVAEAKALAQTGAEQITLARVTLTAAEEGFQLESERIKRGEGLPIETLDSFRQLVDARLEFLAAVVAYNVAQFRLYVALGRTPLPETSAATGQNSLPGFNPPR
ncbi:TolC family protein [Fimbriiglobus ruber]|uniref:Heavy metal RND efflux outer membrane protein, CzcC family n=1 Tax=Fimbriiglobus ruber TaxID=1908690 RepID=A0A225DJP6_9BACT|nr:TolC family protein [Fimbriiglobus ruber]OWK41681.1 Heavy metal RND efflux outer membrane protein, CzcC family [Fimbriiglobus ruber]